MLERLEAADHNAELLPRLEILERHLECGPHVAEHLGAQPDGRAVENVLQDPGALAFRSDEGRRWNLHIRQADDRCGAQMHRLLRSDRQPGSSPFDEEQREARGVALAAGRARDDDERACRRAVEHQRLFAGDAVPRAASRRACCRNGAVVSRAAFLPCKGHRACAVCYARENLFLLLRAAANKHRVRTEKNRRQQRLRHEVAPELFEHARDLDVAHAEPAVLFGDRDRRPAELRHLCPELRRIAGGVIAVTKLANPRDRRLLLDEVGSRRFQHLLVFRKYKPHRLSPEIQKRGQVHLKFRCKVASLE